MKKSFFLSLFIICISCSDGDLQIETLDFDSVVVQNCGTANVGTEIFFKINDDEALILDLASGLLANEVTTDTIESTIPGQSQLTFRAFSGSVTSNYFCDSIPPATPNVVEEIEVSSGRVLITTTTTDEITFTHNIQLSGIILTNEGGETITDLSINNFGTVATSN